MAIADFMIDDDVEALRAENARLRELVDRLHQEKEHLHRQLALHY
jgi:hypothetical protein